MVAQIPVASKYVPVALTFSATSIPNANGTFVSAQGAMPYYTMPFPGSVFGVSIALSAPLTSGALGMSAIIDGVPVTGTFARLQADGTLMSAHQHWNAQRADYTFQAGQRIGVMWRKEGTIAPTTIDATVTMLVLLEGVDF